MAHLIRKLWTRFVDPRNWNSATPFWAVALVLGLIQVWANRFYMGNDGVPYLDMANAYLRGDWHTALNGFFNPLYAWLIGLDFLIFRPSPYWEYPMVELLNFGIYAATVASFEYFLRGWLAWRREDDVAVRVIGYGLFLWSSLILIGVWTVNADMLVAASLLLRSGASATRPLHEDCIGADAGHSRRDAGRRLLQQGGDVSPQLRVVVDCMESARVAACADRGIRIRPDFCAIDCGGLKSHGSSDIWRHEQVELRVVCERCGT